MQNNGWIPCEAACTSNNDGNPAKAFASVEQALPTETTDCLFLYQLIELTIKKLLNRHTEYR